MARTSIGAKENGDAARTACKHGHVDAARLLLDNGAPVGRADKRGPTPLFIACGCGHVDAARLLLERGRRSIGRRRTVDAAVHRLRMWSRRRGAAAAGQGRGGRSGAKPRPDAAGLRLTDHARSSRCSRNYVDEDQRRRWTKARRSTGRSKERLDAAVHRLRQGPRRRGAAVAGQRRGG